MPRMIELIRKTTVPAAVVRTASKGALPLPPEEMIEILVYLSTHPEFGEQARMTLAGWDESACRRVCSDPTTPFEVTAYFLNPQNRRPALIPALLENPSVPEFDLQPLAQEPSAELAAQMLASPRVFFSRNILHSLLSNPVLTPPQQAKVKEALDALPAPTEQEVAEQEAEAELAKFIAEHAQEIAAEEGKAFQLAHAEEEEQAEREAVAAAQAAIAFEAAVAAQAAQAAAAGSGTERMSPLQKIARMSVGDRVQLAMKGNKEDRFILIRDGAKVVSSAVLESSKVTEQEIEMFAAMKNVQESVLRGIAAKRKFIKQYNVVRALVSNPRCPLDVSLTYLKMLMPMDLKGVSTNKNVPDTLRKTALKAFKERTEKKH